MANLNSQNIGLNYKGILNLNTLNGNLSGTLQAVTDGDGNASPLQLSTTQVGLNYSGNNTLLNLNTQASVAGGLRITYASSATEGLEFLYNSAGATISNINSIYASNSAELRFNMQTAAGGIRAMTIFGTGQIAINTTSASAQLQVRGDGTNPIARFESNAGAGRISIADVGTLTTTVASGQANFNFGYVGNATFLNMNTNGVITHYSTSAGSGIETFRVIADGVASHTSGAMRILQVSGAGFSPASGTGIYRPFEINYTLNASGANTGTATGIFLNATETALNGMGHNLMDLQVGGVSAFRVGRNDLQFSGSANGFLYRGNDGTFQYSGGTLNFESLSSASNLILGAGANGSIRLFSQIVQFVGTTNAFPAIKRNGAAIDFRLADDSGYAAISALSFKAVGSAHSVSYTSSGNGSDAEITSTGVGPILRSTGNNITWSQWGSDITHLVGSGGAPDRIGYNMIIQAGISTGNVNGGDIVFKGNPVNGTAGSSVLNTIETLALIKNTGAFVLGTTSSNASAILQADSTTRGFLPPRMTTAQRDLIGTPAAGLMIYNTTTNRPNFYDGSAWVAL